MGGKVVVPFASSCRIGRCTLRGRRYESSDDPDRSYGYQQRRVAPDRHRPTRDKPFLHFMLTSCRQSNEPNAQGSNGRMINEMNRSRALEILYEFTKSESLRKHALAVEACVTAYARKLAEDEEKWSVTALLHDFDWEIHPALPDHPTKGEPILAGFGVSDEIRRAILSHADFTGVPRISSLEKTPFACDELAGFITAVSYVKPHRSVFEVDTISVRKKMKDKAFARSVSREDITNGARDLGVELEEHVAFCVKAMQEKAQELGLKGTL